MFLNVFNVDDYDYWSRDPIAPNTVTFANNIPVMQPRADYVNLQHGVMATSYALLLLLEHNDMDAALPVMKWLISQRQDFIMWSSTQVSCFVNGHIFYIIRYHTLS